ncbi:MAG: hypothetical protein [Wendovervirus sonii]|uniref:Uncharacterized protein n=1 Tax=phage Lak_Megaphage_Sonny TaxID=3109229 RepID=A0ABZ0Z2Q7_9CAUD|nr:MAG: hypothetical protein [phage Lak_Megaphage_Sonny]
MATIKKTSSALGNLISQINGSPQPAPQPFSQGFGNMPSSNYGIDDDSIPGNMLEPEPIFDMNYKSTRKQCIKKAKDQLMIIVKEIIPQAMQNSAVINDKILQDAEQLGSLYYEYEKNEKMIQAVMETVARGEVSPRMFDVYQKMATEQSKLSSKITETQNTMRKYYIDTCMDIQQKEEIDDKPEYKAIAAPSEEHLEDVKISQQSNVIVGTDQVIKMINDRKRQAMIAKYEEVNDEANK